MNGMAVCAGVGGIELGLSLAKQGYQTVCYIEREAYAVAVLRTRMEEKAIHEAPIWDDVETFDGKPWRGKVDIITAGFPCQPWSQAGKRQGTKDERWIWPDIALIIGEVRPRYVFLENVPGLVSGGGLLEVLGDLAKIGYDAEWLHLSAAAVGANHKRERVWILGWDSDRRYTLPPVEEIHQGAGTITSRTSEDVAYSKGSKCEQSGNTRSRREGFTNSSQDVTYTLSQRGRGRNGERQDAIYVNPRSEIIRNGENESWWAVEPPVGRVVNELPYRVDRLRACGNGVVPLVAATAYSILRRRIGGF